MTSNEIPYMSNQDMPHDQLDGATALRDALTKEASSMGRIHNVSDPLASEAYDSCEDKDAEKAGSYRLGDIRAGRVDPGSATHELPRMPEQSRSNRRFTNRRGGRSFPEPSDNDLDPNMKVEALSRSSEQQSIDQAGLVLGRTTLANARQEAELARIFAISDPFERDKELRIFRIQQVARNNRRSAG